MKKLFVAVLAIAALAACNKDNDMEFLQSNKKAVEISIANYVEDTRVIDAPDATKVDNLEKVGTIETLAEDNFAAAEAGQLVVLFANNANNVEQAFTLDGLTATTDGKYRFHDINESVTQVAIVRDASVAGSTGAWTYSYDIDPKNYVGKNLSTYRANALVEYTDNFGVEGMDLFAVSKIETDGTKCTMTDEHANKTYEYTLFTATVEVKPMLARVEITNFQCTDLGETTLAAVTDPTVTGGYDHLTLGTLTFGGNKTYNFNNYVLKGAYCKDDETPLNYFDKIYDGEKNNGKAIAWNISVNTPYPAVKTVTVKDAEGNDVTKEVAGDNALQVKMEAYAHDYQVVNTSKTLSVGFKGAEKFEAGKIYRIAIPFKESNLDASNEAICVEVKVIIANWVVVPVTPVFGN